MSKQKINLLYICLVFMALSLLICIFLTWNSVSLINNDLQGKVLTNFHIDNCEVNQKKIYISGWSFIPDQDHSITKIYTEIQGGKLLPFASNSVVREDISKSIGKDKINRNTEFQASIRFFKKEVLTKNIFIVMKPKEGQQLYVAKYTCQ